MAMAGGERSADDAPKRVTGVTGRVSRGPFGTGTWNQEPYDAPLNGLVEVEK